LNPHESQFLLVHFSHIPISPAVCPKNLAVPQEQITDWTGLTMTAPPEEAKPTEVVVAVVGGNRGNQKKETNGKIMN
jgi:hypothetical protein